MAASALKPPIDIHPHRPNVCPKRYLTSQLIANEASEKLIPPSPPSSAVRNKKLSASFTVCPSLCGLALALRPSIHPSVRQSLKGEATAWTILFIAGPFQMNTGEVE